VLEEPTLTQMHRTGEQIRGIFADALSDGDVDRITLALLQAMDACPRTAAAEASRLMLLGALAAVGRGSGH
jgi:hypothetical protein